MALKDDIRPYKEKGQAFVGVFFKEHPTRRHGPEKLKVKDRLLIIRYTIGGKTRTESFGWISEGYTAQSAQDKIKIFRANFKAGTGPLSLAEELQEDRQKQEVENRAKQVQAQVTARMSTTVADFFKETYLPKSKVDKKPETCRAEESYFTYWVKPVIGGLTFADISIEHLDKIKANMVAGKRGDAKADQKSKQRRKAAPMSARSINAALSVVRQMWNYAADMKPPLVAGQWPGASRRFKKPKINNQRDRFLTRDEADRLLLKLKEIADNAVKPPRRKDAKADYTAHDMALLSLNTGMRFGELKALTWNRVDLARKHLRIPDPKNSDPRTAFLTDGALEMLRRRSLDTKGCNYVFPGSKKDADGKRGPVPGVPSVFWRAVKSLGFNDGVTDSRQRVCFHTLRHSFASWLIDQGEGIRLVGDLLGHRSLTMTRRYTHVSEGAQKAAVAALSKRLSPERGENVLNLEDARKLTGGSNGDKPTS